MKARIVVEKGDIKTLTDDSFSIVLTTESGNRSFYVTIKDSYWTDAEMLASRLEVIAKEIRKTMEMDAKGRE